MSVFWSFIVTRPGGVVWYRQTTNATLHQKALADIQRAYPAVSSIDYLFIATWDHVRHVIGDEVAIAKSNTKHTFSFFIFLLD